MRPRIVLFVELDRSVAALIPAVAEIGDIVAIVANAPERRVKRKLRARARTAPRWSFNANLRSAGQSPQIIAGPMRRDPAALARALGDVRADIMLSLLFPRRIPAEILSLARHGGLNIHPARLPGVAGPRPVHWLIAEDAWSRYGDLTLHAMDDGLDTGPVLAHATLDAGAFSSPERYKAAFAGAASALIREVVPQWLAGDLVAVHQPASDANRWAGKNTAPIAVGAQWSFERLARTHAFLCRSPGLVVAVAKGVAPVSGSPTAIGPPTGIAPRCVRGRLEFDVADARVVARRPNRLITRLARPWKRRDWVDQELPPPLRIRHASEAGDAG